MRRDKAIVEPLNCGIGRLDASGRCRLDEQTNWTKRAPEVEFATAEFVSFVKFEELVFMGKGDKRTKKGKIYRGSYGKRRPRKLKKTKPAPAKRA
jgi:30S ribosomal protein S31